MHQAPQLQLSTKEKLVTPCNTESSSGVCFACSVAMCRPSLPQPGLAAQRDLEMPLLGHRQALLRAIAQLPMLTEAADPGEDSLHPGRTASPPHSAPRCADPCSETGEPGDRTERWGCHVNLSCCTAWPRLYGSQGPGRARFHVVTLALPLPTQEAATSQPARPHSFR